MRADPPLDLAAVRQPVLRVPLRAAFALDLEDVAADRSGRLLLHRVPSWTRFGTCLGIRTAPRTGKPRICGAFVKYRYGDSNPGFRTENCLCEAICGRFVPVVSKEISPVRSSSVESGTYFGTRFFCR